MTKATKSRLPRTPAMPMRPTLLRQCPPSAETPVEAVGRRISEHLVSQRLTKADLARLSGISLPRVARMCAGRGLTTVSMIAAAARVLDVSPGSLFTDDGVTADV
jgi:hypothetical protein